jgi:hypothetical protein
MPGAKAKKKEKVAKRKTRHRPTGSSHVRQGAKTFALLLEEVTPFPVQSWAERR